jgi:glyoxylase-like metal-dependent hydrolase (beta-lactamase superfamily II)
MSSVRINCFFDDITNTVTYLIADSSSKQCAIIDSVLNYDQASATTTTILADQLIRYVKEQQWQCRWILETHAHADHLTAAPYLQKKLGGQLAIGCKITATQALFKTVFNFEESFAFDGSQFDQLLDDGDVLSLGGLSIKVLHTPGHTPACVTYIVEDAAFVGDTLFMPDYGTARCDFPGGDASVLYQSIQKILTLPSQTRLFTGHDYKSPNRTFYAWQSTVAEQKEQNIHIHENVTMDEFTTFRNQRDSSLTTPQLMLPAVQVNIRAGHLPPLSDNGLHYLSLPINVFK